MELRTKDTKGRASQIFFLANNPERHIAHIGQHPIRHPLEDAFAYVFMAAAHDHGAVPLVLYQANNLLARFNATVGLQAMYPLHGKTVFPQNLLWGMEMKMAIRIPLQVIALILFIAPDFA